MKTTVRILMLMTVLPTAVSFSEPGAQQRQKPVLRVVTTLPDYAFVAESVGADRISVEAIVRGDQDAHFIRPKPSFATALRDADVFVSTGLDLELWAQTVIDTSGNRRIRSGQAGYVSAAAGIKLLEKPEAISRAEGGVHIYGNPHITVSPVNMKAVADNIVTGLIKNDPAAAEFYRRNLEQFHKRIDESLFGPELVDMLGGETLCTLAEQGKLIRFLREHKHESKPLVEYLGGWMKKMLPMQGTPIVTYHKNWVYFVKLFGLEEAGTVEPKPGIPPSPKHVTSLITLMRDRNIEVILAATYFDEQKIITVASRTNAEAVIVPLYVGGAADVDDYFKLVDFWIDGLLKAAKKKGLVRSN